MASSMMAARFFLIQASLSRLLLPGGSWHSTMEDSLPPLKDTRSKGFRPSAAVMRSWVGYSMNMNSRDTHTVFPRLDDFVRDPFPARGAGTDKDNCAGPPFHLPRISIA